MAIRGLVRARLQLLSSCLWVSGVVLARGQPGAHGDAPPLVPTAAGVGPEAHLSPQHKLMRRVKEEEDDDDLPEGSRRQEAPRELVGAVDLEHLDTSTLSATELTRIVYESLQSTETQPQVKAMIDRKAPEARQLQQVCLLTNPQSHPEAFLSSEEYHNQVREGQELVHNKRVIFAGLWREIGAGAAQTVFNALLALGSFFRDYQLIMLENDSTDDTVTGIQKACAGVERAWCFTLRGIGKQVLHQGAQNRIVGLTALRQTLLMKILEFDKPGIFDYVMMVDADIFAHGNGGFDIGSTLAAFSLPKRIKADAVCALQVAGRTVRYYDNFAHRGPECSYNNLATSPTCPAASCGGGLVFYTMAALKNTKCNYTYVSEAICEHVPFNACLASHNHGRIFLFKPWAIAMAEGSGDVSDWSCTVL